MHDEDKDDDSYYYSENTLHIEEDQDFFLPDKLSVGQLIEQFKIERDEHSYD
jgi:hypothetical protein